LERESLLVRIERLFALCRPAPDFHPIKNYVYDRDRVERLDRLRHDVVHRPEGTRLAIPDCYDAIEFLFRTGLYLWTMLNYKYGVKMDPFYEIRRSPAFEYALHAMR